VSAGQTIARLEALLARVQRRSAEPRTAARAFPVAAAPVPVQAAEAAAVDELLDEEPDHPTIPPPAVAPVARAAPAPVVAPRTPVPLPEEEAAAPAVAVADQALELSVDVDLAAEEPAPAEPPPRPSPAPEPMVVGEAAGSRERLVAAPAVTYGEPPSPAMPEPASAEMPAAAVASQPAAEEEEPPVSSRRPLAPEPEERLAEMAFGTTEPRPALHTPPPESGRLPAAPEAEFADEDTGVRTAVAPVVPETTKAELIGGNAVAHVQGSVPAFKPATFAELLDASLAL
jgi:hypothetical protein